MRYNKMTFEQQEDFQRLARKKMIYKVLYRKGKQNFLITFENSYNTVEKIIKNVISQNDDKHLYQIEELVKQEVFNYYNI